MPMHLQVGRITGATIASIILVAIPVQSPCAASAPIVHGPRSDTPPIDPALEQALDAPWLD
ncbi:MAG: hypothetical protein ACO3P9_08405, partial [Phycisphaerales bacterium]